MSNGPSFNDLEQPLRQLSFILT